jgi:hypothetical protein
VDVEALHPDDVRERKVRYPLREQPAERDPAPARRRLLDDLGGLALVDLVGEDLLLHERLEVPSLEHVPRRRVRLAPDHGRVVPAREARALVKVVAPRRILVAVLAVIHVRAVCRRVASVRLTDLQATCTLAAAQNMVQICGSGKRGG